MDRNKIKAKAKSIIKNNLWNIWKPYLIILAINSVLSFIAVNVFNIDFESNYSLLTDYIFSFLLLPLTVGYITYILNFIRGKETSIKDIFSQMKNILTIWVVGFIVTSITSIGFAFLIIPGIIFSLMYAMTYYLMADGEKNIGNVISKSSEMMKGYKKDFFVFELSFLGWILLGIVTLGIAFIWIIPYMNVSMALYYEELKKANDLNNKLKPI